VSLDIIRVNRPESPHGFPSSINGNIVNEDGDSPLRYGATFLAIEFEHDTPMLLHHLDLEDRIVSR
jgi:hypothetical protein